MQLIAKDEKVEETLITTAQDNNEDWYRWLKLYICIGGQI